MTRLLFHVALRSLCEGSEERLFLEEPVDTFASELELTDTSSTFTEKYLAAFREALPEDETKAVLQDRVDTGWLAWGRKMEVTRLSGWEEEAWKVDPLCRPGLDLFGEYIQKEEWWKQIADRWAQEEQRNYPSATHIDFVLSICQLYGKPVFESIRPIVDGYLREMEEKKVYDRHHMRAMWEFIAGLLRGTEEWSGKDRSEFWQWLTPKLPELFGNIRHDTTKSARFALDM